MTGEAYAVPSIRAKLQRPQLPEDLISRPRLLERLHQSLQRKLTLISAQAGAGKSTLLAQWLGEVEAAQPSAWLSLDEHDNDLVLFMIYLCEAVRTIFPSACEDTLSLLKAPRTPPIRTIVASLVNELADAVGDPESTAGAFILALDDYHAITERAIHEALANLLTYLPRGVHLAIASRIDPPLPLARLRARGEMLELRSRDLRFTNGETASVLQRVLGRDLGDEIAGVLQEKTEGWIAGLRLAALALDELANHEGREAMIHPASTVLGLDYLAQEVFDRQSPAVREFLLRISVLDRFCVPLCTAVTGYPVEKSKEIVDWVASANLFLVPLDAGGAWYRYHHLFRDLLRLHLEERYDKVEIADLYARASQWFERNGSVEDAIYYALSAGSPEAAARIVKRHRHAAMNQEQWHRLRRWMDQLPDYVVEESVELLLTRAWLLNSEFKTGKLPGLLDRVEAMLDRSDSSYGPEERAVLRGEASALRSALDHWFGQGQLCLEHAQYAIEVTPPEHEWVRGMALDRLPLGFQLVGQLGKAYEAAYALLAQGGQIGSRYIIRGYISLAVIEAAAANLRALQRSATQMLALATEAGLPETRGWALQILGAVHYFWNDLAEAERCFTEVSEMRYQAHPRTVTNSLLGLALTHQALGRSDAATQVSDAAIAWAREVGSVGLMLEAHSLASRLQLMQGRVPDTRRWRSLLDSYGPSGIFGLEIPRLTLAEVLTATGTSEALHEAGELLASMTAFAEKTHWTSGLMRIRALQALRSDALREAETATTLLGEAVEIAAPGRCIRVFVDVGAPMAGLLARLRSRWTTDQSPTRKFVDQLLAAFGPEGQQALARSRRLPPTVEPLTEREREVLVLLGRNLTNREIAEELVISSATVKTHTLNIYRKLGVRGRQQAVARASALGIL